MAPRAQWKGYLKVDAFAFPVALHTAVSTAERASFHTLNRATGHRVRRELVDAETGAVVDHDDQVKGYEVGEGRYVTLEPEEVAAAVPEADKTLDVAAFVPCSEIDEIYLERPYYLVPADASATEAFVLLREGLAKAKAVALAHAVLFRRARTLLIRPEGKGLIATLLNFDYEVRSAADAFKTLPDLKASGEMLDLARHIIKTKMGAFDPAAFEDRYEAALADLIAAKQAGRPIARARPAAEGNVVDLMEALRRSAGKPAKGGTKGSAKVAAGAKGKGTAKSRAKGAAKPAAAKASGRRKAG